MKSLVAYFSASGITQRLASALAEASGSHGSGGARGSYVHIQDRAEGTSNKEMTKGEH